jgi:transcriptional regulator with XRE-family HTH domain
MQATDERILRLIDLLIFQKKITYTKDFCQEINVLEQTISKIKKGTSHFTVEHIQSICKKYNVNANWIFGMEKNVFNTSESIEITSVKATMLPTTPTNIKKTKNEINK